ncbi:MAG: LpqB family beta-propeller domain-containing protein [Nocardioides sp.]
MTRYALSPVIAAGSARRPLRHGARWLLVVLSTALLSGCLQLPESGPVVPTKQTASGTEQSGPFIEPAPPAPGESPAEIVRHFLDAMMASSLQTNVARQFLTREAASTWDPETETIVYSSASPASGTQTVQLNLTGVNRLDRNGTWVGRQEVDQLSFPIVQEDGEYRISEVPNALIVPERWFVLRFRQLSLYYFDPTGHLLVPEPVYVPRGEQLATSVVTALLAGPPSIGGTPGSVARTFAPSGLAVELSVVVDGQGVARVVLQGDPAAVDRDVLPLFLAQLAWTMRQDPQVRFFTLTIGGVPIALPDGVPELSVDFGAEYDPTIADASSLLFGLRSGRLVRASPGAVETLQGPLGRTAYGVREIAVNFEASRVAAVTSDGGRILMTEVDNSEASVQEVLSGGANLGKPSWDGDGDLWVLDRRATGGRVAVIDGDGPRSITLEGVSGASTRRLIISRDGSRYAAIVRRDGTDSVVVGRIAREADGSPVRGIGAHVVYPSAGASGSVVSALGWVAADRLALVLRVTSGRDQIQMIGVDAGPTSLDLPGTSRLLGSTVTRLVTSPKVAAPIYARTKNFLETPFERDLGGAIDPAIQALTYVG